MLNAGAEGFEPKIATEDYSGDEDHGTEENGAEEGKNEDGSEDREDVSPGISLALVQLAQIHPQVTYTCVASGSPSSQLSVVDSVQARRLTQPGLLTYKVGLGRLLDG